MNKYKIVSLVLAVALLAALARIAVAPTSAPVAATNSPVLENIFARKSVRSYLDRPVSREQLDTLLRAAMAAPSGRDMRPWRFVVIDDEAAMKALADSLPYAKMLDEAKAAIVVCGDLRVKDDNGRSSRNWPLDCSAATENLLLAAESMGLGAVWTGVYPYEERVAAVKSALALPDSVIPLNLIPIGYPKGTTQPKDKYAPENIHYNRW